MGRSVGVGVRRGGGGKRVRGWGGGEWRSRLRSAGNSLSGLFN